MQSQADVTRLTPVASLFRKLFIIVFEIKGSMSVVGASILGGIRDVSRVERRAVRGTCAGERKGILSVAVDLIDIPAVRRVIHRVCVTIKRLGIEGRAADWVDAEEAAKAVAVITGEGVVEAGFWVALVAGELVILGARSGLQSLRMRHLLAVGSEFGIVANSTRIWSVAQCDRARRAEVVGEEVEDIATGVQAGYAAADKEHVFVRDVPRRIGFGDGGPADPPPVDGGNGALSASRCV